MNAPQPIEGSECLSFPVYDEVPKGCHLAVIKNGQHAPHLRPGEWAIVDPSDREPVIGELYQVRYDNGHEVIWQVCGIPATYNMAPDCEPCAMLRPLNNPRTREDAERRFREQRDLHMSDGPITLSYLREITVGRVIGIYVAIPLAEPSNIGHRLTVQ